MNEQILKLLETVDNVDFSLAAELFKIIESCGNQSELFQSLCENIEFVDSDKSKKLDPVCSEEDLKNLKKQYDKVIDDKIKDLIAQRLEEKDFYSNLWNFIITTPVLSNKLARPYALFFIIYDDRIPYFLIPKPEELSEQDFSDRTIKLRKSIQKIRFIIKGSNYSNNAELSWSLLSFIEEFKDKKDRLLLLAFIMFFISSDKN